MASLQSIGRAQPIAAIQDFHKNENFIKAQDQQRAISNLDMTIKKQAIDVNQRAIDAQIAQEKKLDIARPIEVLKLGFEGGGGEGTAGHWALQVASQHGLIDMSQGGEGTITLRNQKELERILSEPRMAQKMSRKRIEWGRSALSQAQEALMAKPDDEKAQAAYQKASTFLTQALWSDKSISEGLKNQKEPKDNRTTEIKNFEYGQENPGFAESQEGDGKQSSLKTLIDEMNNLKQGDPNREIYQQKIAKEISSGKGVSLTTNPDGTFSLSMGGEGTNLTKPVETSLQKDIIGLEQQSEDLKVLGESFKKGYLTYGGKLKRFALKEYDKINPDLLDDDQRTFIQGAREFTEGVEQIFNAYRKEITGAQAAMKELAMLRGSILNKKLTPSEFDASFNRYVSQINRGLRLKKYFLGKGIEGNELNEKLDRNILAGNDAVDMRGDEIEQEFISQGVPENQIEELVKNQLKKEGF